MADEKTQHEDELVLTRTSRKREKKIAAQLKTLQPMPEDMTAEEFLALPKDTSLFLTTDGMSPEQLEALDKLIRAYPGICKVVLGETADEPVEVYDITVAPTDENSDARH
jgi:hypothetical protein